MSLKDPEARRAYQRARYSANPERFAAANKRWYDKNRDTIQAKRREHRDMKAAATRARMYGLMPAQFGEMLAAQGGRCAICRSEMPRGRGSWHVDHDHSTGIVRGLLCHHCNIGLGNFADSPKRLREAASYLERH